MSIDAPSLSLIEISETSDGVSKRGVESSDSLRPLASEMNMLRSLTCTCVPTHIVALLLAADKLLELLHLLSPLFDVLAVVALLAVFELGLLSLPFLLISDTTLFLELKGLKYIEYLIRQLTDDYTI